MDTSLIADIQGSTARLLGALSLFEEADFNQVPFPGSWTAAQVLDHVLKSESGLPALLAGETDTASRPPDTFIPELRRIFLDFSSRLQSPDFIVPGEGPWTPGELRSRFLENRARIEAVVGGHDMERIARGASFPGMGLLSGMEWICFINCHSRRHAQQLERIRAALDTTRAVDNHR